MPIEYMEAGKGQHHYYVIESGTPDGEQLSPQTHYLGIDAVCWFINKDSNWFKKRMASGTMNIALASGYEEYNVSLGTFSLDENTNIAPVFNNPVLPDRNYRGGSIKIVVHLNGISNDTIFCKILKSASSASLNIVSGMVSTASISGPSQILGAAGQDIIKGVQGILDTDENQMEAFFDKDSGIQLSINPNEITSSEMFVLLHRGNNLDKSKIEINSQGNLIAPYYDGQLLMDGAWILLRLRRSKQYSGVREWFKDEKAMRLRIDNLVGDYFLGITNKDKALEEFSQTNAGNKTLMDDFIKYRNIIGVDGVISENEAIMRTNKITTRITAARKAISMDKKSLYEETIRKTFQKISIGELPDDDVNVLLDENLNSVTKFREEWIADLPKALIDERNNNIMSQQVYMKNVFTESREEVEDFALL